MTPQKYLAGKVRHERESRGWTHYKLGIEIGEHHTTVARIEEPIDNPSAVVVWKLARLFGLSIDSMMGTFERDVQIGEVEE